MYDIVVGIHKWLNVCHVCYNGRSTQMARCRVSFEKNTPAGLTKNTGNKPSFTCKKRQLAGQWDISHYDSVLNISNQRR